MEKKQIFFSKEEEDHQVHITMAHPEEISIPIPQAESASEPTNLRREESVEAVDVKARPATPAKKVNFHLNPSQHRSAHGVSPGRPVPRGTKSSSSSSSSSSIKNFLIPKLNFMEKPSPEAEPGHPEENNNNKVSISRSWSLSKMFSPGIKRASSLPITPVGKPNPLAAESAAAAACKTKGSSKGAVQQQQPQPPQVHIHRSLSLPVPAAANKDGSRKMESFFRVIPSTPPPRLKDSDSIVSAEAPAGESVLEL
ncbi:unnamed protein product [Cuscuta campestris]|uniref:Uncharacterized protein n=1 Tax=Cuscuta campestris TaxID=132261 RepID=A0A484LZD8_9ASTE|nr:unnamed protein product [Cuscuta campestris]